MTDVSIKRNPNPYKDVNWDSVIRVTGCTHMHCTNPVRLGKYIQEGLEFVTLSNYYPSTPWYPLANIRENTFKLKQPGYIFNGEVIKEELDIRKTVSQWSPELAANLPENEGDLLFPNIPDHILEAPNTEHGWFVDSDLYLHICALGSTMTCSHFDNKNQFGLQDHGYKLGCPLPWRKAFDEMFDALMIPDGGGVVIAHPHWSHLPFSFLTELLDYDPRVLGIEVYNNHATYNYTENSEVEWDYILSTGRQCFGFFVQDHPPRQKWRGKCILLPEERTAESCLKAYREGRFYGALNDNGLVFEHISFDGNILRAKCNKPVNFLVTSAKGVVAELYKDEEIIINIKEEEKKDLVFLRLTALLDQPDGDKLFAQPFILI